MSERVPYNETELLLRITEGDKTAFKELHDYYWNNLYSVALSFLKSPEWAMDVIQEVFLKLWERYMRNEFNTLVTQYLSDSITPEAALPPACV